MKNTIFLAGFLAIGSFASILGMSEDIPELDKGQEVLKKLDAHFRKDFNDYVLLKEQYDSDEQMTSQAFKNELKNNIESLYNRMSSLAEQGATVDFIIDEIGVIENHEIENHVASLHKMLFWDNTEKGARLMLEHGVHPQVFARKYLEEGNKQILKLLLSYNVIAKEDLNIETVKQICIASQREHALYKKDWQNAYIVLRLKIDKDSREFSEYIMKFVGPKKMKTFAEQAAWNHQHAFDCQQGRRKKYLESQSSSVSKSTSKTIASKKFIDKDDTKHDDDGNVVKPKGLI